MIKFKSKTPAPEPPKKGKAAPAESADHEPLFQIKDFPENHVLYHIHKNTPAPRSARPHDVVHASDLDPVRNWCPKEPALLTLHKKKRKSDFVSTAQRMTWGMGYKGADLLMDLIPRQKVWGNWKCRSCSHEMKFSYSPTKCGGCGGNWKAIRYVEVFLRDPVSKIVGSVDCFVDILGNGIKTPMEFKTEGNSSFKPRTKPEFDHEWRTMLYLWLIAQTPGMVDKGLNPNEGRVLYFTKEGWADCPKIKEWKLSDWPKSSVKEYWVNRNDSMVANKIDAAMSYRLWREKHDLGVSPNDNPMPERVCQTAQDTKAKNCVVCKECFK